MTLSAHMTWSQLARFVEAVDTVLEADDLDPRERLKLIDCWAYQYGRTDMPQQLQAAIKRCQGDPVHPTTSSIIDAISGETVAYSP